METVFNKLCKLWYRAAVEVALENSTNSLMLFARSNNSGLSILALESDTTMPQHLATI